MASFLLFQSLVWTIRVYYQLIMRTTSTKARQRRGGNVEKKPLFAIQGTHVSLGGRREGLAVMVIMRKSKSRG